MFYLEENTVCCSVCGAEIGNKFKVAPFIFPDGSKDFLCQQHRREEEGYLNVVTAIEWEPVQIAA